MKAAVISLFFIFFTSISFADTKSFYLGVCATENESGKFAQPYAVHLAASPLSIKQNENSQGDFSFTNAERTSGHCRAIKGTGKSDVFIFDAYRASASGNLDYISYFCDFTGDNVETKVVSTILTPDKPISIAYSSDETPYVGHPTKLIYFLVSEKEKKSRLDSTSGMPVDVIKKCVNFAFDQ